MCFESQTTSTTYEQTAKYRKEKGFGFFFQRVLVIPSTILFYFFRTPFALTIIVKWPLFFFYFISTTSLKAIRSAIKKVWENSLVSFSCLDKARENKTSYDLIFWFDADPRNTVKKFQPTFDPL